MFLVKKLKCLFFYIFMKQSISSTIQQNLNVVYNKNLVKKWPADLMNAKLAIKYVWSSKTIFDLSKKSCF